MNDGAKGIVEMLFCTSLLALVGAADQPQSSPRKLQIVNTKRQSMICELLFPSSILAVKLNRKTLVIVLETEIYIYDISNMRLLHVIETTPNPDAIVALSPSSDPISYLAYPSPVPSPPDASEPASSSSNAGTSSSAQCGDVLLFSCTSLTVSNVIRAHRAPLSCISLNHNATLLATASTKGTVIRVFSVPGAQKLWQFRRGTREARVWSLAWNPVGSLLACASERGTVHIFKLAKGGEASAKSSSSTGSGEMSPSGSLDSRDEGGMEGGYEAFIEKQKGKGVSSSLRRKSLQISKSLTSYLPIPSAVTEIWEPTRDFAHLRLPSPVSGTSSRCVVGLSGTLPHVMVISSDGYFYAYSIDLENGGECSLMKQFSLLDSSDDSEGVKG